MRIVIQRIAGASVTIGEKVTSQIGAGLLILASFQEEDTEEDLDWMSRKIVQLRIFSDENGKPNLNVMDMDGEVMVVSQFTLHAATQKGNRPSYTRAAKPEKAIPLYELFLQRLTQQLGKPVATGIFGAYMQVHLLNDGPVTIIIDSKRKDF